MHDGLMGPFSGTWAEARLVHTACSALSEARSQGRFWRQGILIFLRDGHSQRPVTLARLYQNLGRNGPRLDLSELIASEGLCHFE